MVHSLFLLALVTICTAFGVQRSPVNFQAGHHSTYINSRVPARYDLSEDQIGGSYWTSTFLTATTRKQYLAVMHILGAVCKSSVLELDTLKYWSHVDYAALLDSSESASNSLDVRLTNCGIGSNSEDRISTMYNHVSTKDYTFNFTLEASSKVILNAGGGAFTFGQGYSNTTQWSLPSCKTRGTITVGDKAIKVNPSKSFTWYDHQKGGGAPQNWTWFELHFPGSSVKASIWVYNLPQLSATTYQFATVRIGEESQYIVALEMMANMDNTWTSPKTNITYPLSWTLKFENGDRLVVKSVLPDQEIYGSKQLADTVYAGYATASGRFFGQKTGYGVVEMIAIFQS
ncbi:hypothetical protein BKA56DRAFT_315064 [Ilyonectria sp. MPI-CAGE-AT-0026]|nr:hypothetical protein BKA56DRAFT_315064 [Ilyonectria sp. MPI-CAGE-AT-0026]